MKLNEETYLGDGLYASYDGFTVKLRAPRAPQCNPDHWVALEPEILANFMLFIAQNLGPEKLLGGKSWTQKNTPPEPDK